MVPRRFTVPVEDGQLLASPPLEGWCRWLVAARDSFRRAALQSPFASLVPRARRQVVAAARRYTRPLPGGAAAAPGPVGGSSPEAPLILTGHQPLFYHPGIWAKHLLAREAAARTGGVAVNLVVDGDTLPAVDVLLPATGSEGRLVTVRERLCPVPGGVPFEGVAAPSPELWRGFLARVEGHLRSLPASEALAAFRGFAAGTAGAAGAGGAVDPSGEVAPGGAPGGLPAFMSWARRRFEEREGLADYLELPVSHMAETPEFLTFVAILAREAEPFAAAYNQALAEYRALRGIRSRANPFPDLGRDGDRVELPFWFWQGHGPRHDLCVRRRGADLFLEAGGEVRARLPAAGDPARAGADLLEQGIRLRPKALALTLFLRLCVGDVFIHGVGGGNYDLVTDFLIRSWAGVEPPPYAVLSLTLFLPLGGPPQGAGAEAARLRQRLRDLRFNPQRFVRELPHRHQRDTLRRLVEEKEELIRRIQEGREKKRLTREIERVNRALSGALAGLVAESEQALAEAVARAEEERVRAERGYPYFLYAPGEVARRVSLSCRAAAEVGRS